MTDLIDFAIAVCALGLGAAVLVGIAAGLDRTWVGRVVAALIGGDE